jgi:hypothetical protein
MVSLLRVSQMVSVGWFQVKRELGKEVSEELAPISKAIQTDQKVMVQLYRAFASGASSFSSSLSSSF